MSGPIAHLEHRMSDPLQVLRRRRPQYRATPLEDKIGTKLDLQNYDISFQCCLASLCFLSHAGADLSTEQRH